MSFLSKSGLPQAPTLPTGIQIASFDTYLEAQRAVDQLSDEQFEVQHTTIVGTDLRMVERITGRLSYPRVVLAGAMSGAWFGLFVGLLFGLLSEGSIVAMILPALIIGAAFGMMFALVSYAFTGGKRDFTSSSQVVAGRYALLCEESRVGQARNLLEAAGIRTHVGGDVRAAAGPGFATPPPPQTPAAPGAGVGGAPSSSSASSSSAPSSSSDEPARTTFRPWEDEHGNPRYGQRLPQDPAPGGSEQADGEAR